MTQVYFAHILWRDFNGKSFFRPSETYILKNFPPHVRQIMGTQMVSVLGDNVDANKLLTSTAHIKWAMECIGVSFTLNMEDEEMIGTAIEIYRRWVFEPAKRPMAWEEYSQFFLSVRISSAVYGFGVIPAHNFDQNLLK